MQTIVRPKPKKEWIKQIPLFEGRIDYFIKRVDTTRAEYDEAWADMFKKADKKYPGLYDWMYSGTMPGKFDQYCDLIKKQGYGKLIHEDRIFLTRYVVTPPDRTDNNYAIGTLHSKQNLLRLKRAGYPAHLLTVKFNKQDKATEILKIAKKNPNKIPFDLTKSKRVRFSDGNGDMNQFLKDNILGGARLPSKTFTSILKKVAPKWIELLKNHKQNNTDKAKKESKRDIMVKRLLDLAKQRPRVGADKHGGGFHEVSLKYEHTTWFKALHKSKPKQFAKIQKEAPWWFGQSRKDMTYPVVCPYGGSHGAKKLDLLDYARNKKNKVYKFALSAKAKTETDTWMKSVFTYCTKSRVKNGYDKKFHLQLLKLRPEVKELFPL